MPQMFGILVSLVSSWGELKNLTWICIQASDPPQTEVWMIDRLGWDNWETTTIMPIIGSVLPLPVPLLFLHLFLCTKRLHYAAGWRAPVSAHLCFFSLVVLSFWSAFVWGEKLLLWCWCTFRYERSGCPQQLHALLGESPPLLGPRGFPQNGNCKDVTVFSSR